MSETISNTSITDKANLLESGIAAAKARQPKKARKLLKRAIRRDQSNVRAWIWLSSVVDDPEQKTACLQKILAIDPTNKAAKKGLKALCRQQDNRPENGRAAITDQLPPDAVPAPAETSEVIEIPHKHQAERRDHDEGEISDRTLPEPEPEPDRTATNQRAPVPPVSRYKKIRPISAAPTAGSGKIVKPLKKYKRISKKPAHNGVTLQKVSRSATAPSSVNQPPLGQRLSKLSARAPEDSDIFLDEYGCPYCASATDPDDETCLACNQRLWSQTLRRKKPSFMYRALLWTHIVSNITYLSVVSLVLQASVNIGLLAPVQAVLSFILCLPSMAYFLAILFALQRRMRIFFNLYLVQAILFFGFSTAVATGLGFSAIPGPLKVIAACLAVMAIIQFFMALNLGEDFTFDKNRILLRGDPDISHGDEFMKRGNHYAREKMWALAIVHFRRASYLFPNALDPLLSLIVAYVNLEKYDFAAGALVRAKQLNPAHPKVLGLTTLLAEKTRKKAPGPPKSVRAF